MHSLVPTKTSISHLFPFIRNNLRFGPRFPPMSNVYPKELRDLGMKIGKELQMDGYMREGVYCAQMGPAYETPAEARFLRMIGADAVGMSTVHETTVACHASMKVFAMSLITNMIVLDENSKVLCNHEEVLQTSAKRSEAMKTFVMHFVKEL